MRISVALCTYNGEKFIEEQLDSILNQSTKVHEIIICDDGSSDTTIEIINNYISKYPDIVHLYQNVENLGSNRNFEKAISLCNGDYIFLSDQDDIWKPYKVEKTIEKFIQIPSAEGVFSNADLIDESGIINPEYSLWDNTIFIEDELSGNFDLLSYFLKKGNFLTGATFCFKKQVKEFLLPFPKLNSYFHDEWIALVLSKRNTLHFTNEKLISYRIHSSQQVGAISKSKIIKHKQLARFYIGLEQTKNFSTLNKIYCNYFRNFDKLRTLKNDNPQITVIDLDEIVAKILDEIKKVEYQLKKSNFILFHLNNSIDKIRGKRQIMAP